jgi:hypothetical protein
MTLEETKDILLKLENLVAKTNRLYKKGERKDSMFFIKLHRKRISMFEVQEEAECIVREGDLEFYRAWADRVLDKPTNYKDPYRDKILEYIEEANVSSLVESVASFNIDDLSNMAESLISITNLQRHITSAEESVGGPVDVAVITRSEGFTWIKRKNTLSADY